jgi:hypothetical protein
MAMHIYTSTGWKAVNRNDAILDDRGLAYYYAGFWQNASNAKIRTSGGWVGFLDDITLYPDGVSATASEYAEAQWGINSSTGKIFVGGDVSGDTYSLCLNPANLGQYQIKVVRTYGTFEGGSSAEDTWISCATSPYWFVSRGTNGTNDVEFQAEVRNTITGEVLASAPVSLSATVEGF